MLSYPKPIYCLSFVLLQLVLITKVISAKTLLSPNCENFIKYPKFRLKYLQRRSMLQKTEHTVLKVGLRTNIIFKKMFGHSLNYCTGHLIHHRVPSSTFFIATNATKWLHTIHFHEKESFLCNRLKKIKHHRVRVSVFF